VPAANSATDRPDQRQAAGDLQPAQEVRHGHEKAEVEQGLPAADAVDLKEIAKVAVGRVQAERRVGEDRKERDDRGADQECQCTFST
jgi:phage/plasmid primase-like uncharacterized protein